MNTVGSFGNSPMQGDEMDQSQYDTSGVGQDENAYSNPSQGSFTGGNPGYMKGSAGAGYDTGLGSASQGGYGGSQGDRRGGFQGVYGDDSQCTFGGQGCTSAYDQTGRSMNQRGPGYRPAGAGYTDYNQGYGGGASMQNAYGPQSGAAQDYGGNQRQQKGGFVNTAKTLYKDYKKEKGGGSQDNQGRGSMGN